MAAGQIEKEGGGLTPFSLFALPGHLPPQALPFVGARQCRGPATARELFHLSRLPAGLGFAGKPYCGFAE